MIFARDKSQMCNNLLQYAHVYAWGREHGRKVISMRFSYKYRYFKICHTPLTSFPLYLAAKYAAALKLLPTASFKHADCDREALERKMLRKRNIVVSGWNVRFYDLFLKYRSEICDLFTLDSCYCDPVRVKMQQAEGRGDSGDSGDGRHAAQGAHDILRLGVHIRRGDYAAWGDGRYFYSDEVFAEFIRRFAALHPEKSVHAYLSTNDPAVSEQAFQALCPEVTVHCFQGSAPEDLFMLSECDYLIGPPSTYSLVAAMYRDIPLFRMDSADAGAMTADAFRRFDYWFRRIV